MKRPHGAQVPLRQRVGARFDAGRRISTAGGEEG